MSKNCSELHYRLSELPKFSGFLLCFTKTRSQFNRLLKIAPRSDSSPVPLKVSSSCPVSRPKVKQNYSELVGLGERVRFGNAGDSSDSRLDLTLALNEPG